MVGIVDVDLWTGRGEHVGMRDEATLESCDPARADRLLEKYLAGEWAEWPDMFHGVESDDYRLIRFVLGTVVARGQSHSVGSATGE